MNFKNGFKGGLALLTFLTANFAIAQNQGEIPKFATLNKRDLICCFWHNSCV